MLELRCRNGGVHTSGRIGLRIAHVLGSTEARWAERTGTVREVCQSRRRERDGDAQILAVSYIIYVSSILPTVYLRPKQPKLR